MFHQISVLFERFEKKLKKFSIEIKFLILVFHAVGVVGCKIMSCPFMLSSGVRKRDKVKWILELNLALLKVCDFSRFYFALATLL